ncbi:MAG: outer membrane protein transport protein [Proteobacteria bacterium]|nr:outer membrane protein transport protein [Pseudomonadota bacterium]
MKARYNIWLLINCLGLFLFCVASAEANPNILYTSAPNPVGSGARALGMGGAFIAIADDATAASWNPAGLVQLKRPELSVVGSYVRRNDSFDSIKGYGTLEDSNVSLTDLNYLSVVLPFSIFCRNMVVSLNYQRLYDYSSDGEFSDDMDTVKRKASGNLAPLGIAYSLQITPELKWGITFNFWDRFGGSNQLKEEYSFSGSFEFLIKVTHRFKGFNINTGFLWQPSEVFGIGAVVKSPFTADIKAKTATFVMGEPFDEETYETDKQLKMPVSFGVGAYYKLNDIFKISVDIYQTNWNKYIYIDENDIEYSAVTGLEKNTAHVDATRQVRAGMEYLIVKPAKSLTYPLRLGVFYDPIPDKGSPVDAYGGSLGVGLSAAHFAIDGFYQYKFSVNHFSVTKHEEYYPDDVKEHTIYVSFIYYI